MERWLKRTIMFGLVIWLLFFIMSIIISLPLLNCIFGASVISILFTVIMLWFFLFLDYGGF